MPSVIYYRSFQGASYVVVSFVVRDVNFVIVYIMYVQFIFGSVKIAQWPPFWENDTLCLTTVLFVSCLFFVVLVISYCVFEDGILVLFVPVPDCLLFIIK